MRSNIHNPNSSLLFSKPNPAQNKYQTFTSVAERFIKHVTKAFTNPLEKQKKTDRESNLHQPYDIFVHYELNELAKELRHNHMEIVRIMLPFPKSSAMEEISGLLSYSGTVPETDTEFFLDSINISPAKYSLTTQYGLKNP